MVKGVKTKNDFVPRGANTKLPTPITDLLNKNRSRPRIRPDGGTPEGFISVVAGG